MQRVTVITLVCGDRWKFLSQVVEAVMKDEHVIKMVIVDNASYNKEELIRGLEKYGDRIVLLHQEKNLGPGTGFNIGLKYARGVDCEFVFLLDDDEIPEEGFVSKFLEIKKLFGERKVVLLSNKVNIFGTQRVFYEPWDRSKIRYGVFFEVFSFSKVLNFFRLLLGINKKTYSVDESQFTPLVPVESFAYGGAFIPIEAVRENPLPDTTFRMYGDDGEYSWSMFKLGYVPYLCYSPKLYDIDLSVGAGSNISGYFDPATKPYRVYYHLKSGIRISRIHRRKSKVMLFLNIFFWNLGLCILGFFKYGINSATWNRAKIVAKAVYAGYFIDTPPPEEVKLP